MRLAFCTALTAACLALPAAAFEGRLDLRCDGTATATTTSIPIRDDKGVIVRPAQIRDTQTRQVFRLRVDGNTGKLEIPKAVQPVIELDADGGWWNLSDFAVQDKQIVGRYRASLTARGTVRIDRVSGDIEVKAPNLTFSGVCAKEDRATNKF